MPPFRIGNRQCLIRSFRMDTSQGCQFQQREARGLSEAGPSRSHSLCLPEPAPDLVRGGKMPLFRISAIQFSKSRQGPCN